MASTSIRESPSIRKVLGWLVGVLVTTLMALIGSWATATRAQVSDNTKDIVSLRESQAKRGQQMEDVSQRLERIEDKLDQEIQFHQHEGRR